MTEINRIVKLFTDLQHGYCWIGTNFKEALYGIDATTATKKISLQTNNIWQITAHIIYWRSTVINRLNGDHNPPPFRDFLLPEQLNAAAWKQTSMDFERTYHLLRSAIIHFNPENLEKNSLLEGQTNYQLLMGCLQHDAYHMGQIILLKKAFENKAL